MEEIIIIGSGGSGLNWTKVGLKCFQHVADIPYEAWFELD